MILFTGCIHFADYHSIDSIYAYRIIVPLFADSMSTGKMSINPHVNRFSRLHNVQILLPRRFKTEVLLTLSIFMTLYTFNSVAAMQQLPQFYDQKSLDFSMPVVSLKYIKVLFIVQQ